MEPGRIKYLLKLSIILAAAYTICFYRNKTGIACTIFGIVTVGLLFRVAVKRKIQINKYHLFYGCSGILLSTVPALWANEFCIFVSQALFVLIMVRWAISIYFKVDTFEFERNISILFYFVLEGIGQIFSPFIDVRMLRKEKQHDLDRQSTSEYRNEVMKRQSRTSQIIIGIVLSFPLLIIVLCLLLSADAIFRDVVGNIFQQTILGFDHIFLIIQWLFTLGVSFLVIYGCGKGLLNGRIRTEAVTRNKVDNVIGITFTTVFAVLYVLFCFIQIIGLCNTNGSMLPDNVTYSEYARQGFFQLLFVCVINVVMILACKLKFSDSKWLRRILTIISVCTYIMIVSSAYRMILYIRCYQLTFLRILVLWSLLVIAVIMGFIIVFIYRENIPLFEYLLISVTVLFLIFTFLSPDRIIARYNIAHFDWNRKDDISYLTYHISEDGTGIILDKVDENEYKKWIDSYCRRIIEDYEDECRGDIRAFNVSKYIAYREACRYMADEE